MRVIKCVDGEIEFTLPAGISELYDSFDELKLAGKHARINYHTASLSGVLGVINGNPFPRLSEPIISEIIELVDFLMLNSDTTRTVLGAMFRLFDSDLHDTKDRANNIVKLLVKYPFMFDDPNFIKSLHFTLSNEPFLDAIIPALLDTPNQHMLPRILENHGKYVWKLRNTYPKLLGIVCPKNDMCTVDIIKCVNNYEDALVVYGCIIDAMKNPDNWVAIRGHAMTLRSRCMDVCDKKKIECLIKILFIIAGY